MFAISITCESVSDNFDIVISCIKITHTVFTVIALDILNVPAYTIDIEFFAVYFRKNPLIFA